MMSVHINLVALASSLPQAWRSAEVGQAAGATLKGVRMADRAHPTERLPRDEARLVLEGQLHPQIGPAFARVGSGEVCIVPAGIPHAVAEGSLRTLAIIGNGA